MTNTVIVECIRTPIGSFQGSLFSVKSTDLGAAALKELINRTKIDPSRIDGVIMGCVLPAGLGQAPARQAMLSAGIPNTVSALTINKVCSSGLKAVMLADQMIRAEGGEIFFVGGMESMTNSPYLLPNGRSGYRLGDGKITDSMVFDGLWDIHSSQHMGSCAELCAEKYGFTREAQDQFAINSYKKAQRAIESNVFDSEIVKVEIPQRKGDPIIFDKDEEPGRVNFDKMLKLRPAFKKDGTITPANASSISDGAAALAVLSVDRAKKEGLKPLAKIISHAEFSHEPEWFTTAPVGAIKKALNKANLKVEDVDLFEINEAFSVVTMAAMKELNIDESKVNIHGGAVALGHPIGASGARILTTLIHALKQKGLKRGLATLCNGGGESTAIIVELLKA